MTCFFRVVNVPIADSDVIKTVTSLPRSHKDNGLVWVKFKRQLLKKAVYRSEMVRPQKIIDALKWLIKNHPAYKNIKIRDFDNLEDLFCSEEEAVTEPNIVSDTEPEYVDEESDKEDSDHTAVKEGISQSNNEKKETEESQFINVTAIFPQELQSDVIVNSSDDAIKSRKSRSSESFIEVAPGENKIPSNWLREKDFDTTAFYYIHCKGENGLNADRDIDLTPVKFFGSRVINANTVFAEEADYVLVAAQFVERQQVTYKIILLFS